MLLATQPLHSGKEYFNRHIRHKPFNNVVVYPLHQEFVAHHKAFNAVIESVSNESNIWFLDNSPNMDDRDELFIDFVHFTLAGVQTLAVSYADFLVDKFTKGSIESDDFEGVCECIQR